VLDDSLNNETHNLWPCENHTYFQRSTIFLIFWKFIGYILLLNLIPKLDILLNILYLLLDSLLLLNMSFCLLMVMLNHQPMKLHLNIIIGEKLWMKSLRPLKRTTHELLLLYLKIKQPLIASGVYS